MALLSANGVEYGPGTGVFVMPARSVSTTDYLLSQAHRYEVTTCPSCSKTITMRGPLDGKRNARFTFTRTYYCIGCWWDRSIEMKDDAAEAEAKHLKAEAKKKKQREQARRT